MLEGCTIDSMECDCLCHREKGVCHVMACCGQCPHCDRNIKEFYLDKHMEACKEEREKLNKEMQDLLDKE